MANLNILKKIISIYILICLFFLSCSKSNENGRVNMIIYSGFLEDIQLQGEPIPEIEEIIFPLNIGLFDNKIIFCDYESDPHFYVYKVPEFSFLGSFGNQGRGPLDISDPVFWDQIIDNKMGVYQMNLMKFGFYDLDKFLNKTIIDKDVNFTYMPPEINDAVNIIEIKDDVFIGSGPSASGEFFIYNAIDKSLNWKPFIKDLSDSFMNKLKDYDITYEYKRGLIKAKPDRSMFVKTYNYIPYIDVFNPEGNLLFTISPENVVEPKIDVKTRNISTASKIYYSNCFLTDAFIYAVHSNCSLEDLVNENCNNAEVHVFDWKGNALKKYALNESIGPLSPLVVDEKHNYIYTVNPKNVNSYFSKFKLPK